jgi:DNA-directed RNA polymerase specialized sigma24 family protein
MVSTSLGQTEGAKPMSIEDHLPAMQVAASVRANRIVRELNLPWHERADICQDLLLEMLRRFGRFDPGRASAATFINVLARHAAHAVRHQHRAKGLLSQTVPLDPEYSETDLLSSADDRYGSELKRKVEHAVSTLPAPLRGLVDLLMDDGPGKTRRRSGLSHATFYRRLGEIRLHFLSEGLDPAG